MPALAAVATSEPEPPEEMPMRRVVFGPPGQT